MKLEDALFRLNTFLSKVQDTKTIFDIVEWYKGFDEINKLPSLFVGKNRDIINKKLMDLDKAIETIFVALMKQFLGKLQTIGSLDNVSILLTEFGEINFWINKFKCQDTQQIQQMREQMKLALKETLYNLTTQEEKRKETKEPQKPEETRTETFPDKPMAKDEKDRKINVTRVSELFHVRKMIGVLQEKASLLKDNGEDTPASIAANLLCENMETFATSYEFDEIDLETFKQKANWAIFMSHEELDKPRGYCVKHILANLALAVFTLGVGYLIAAACKGTFFPISPNTDSANKVNMLDDSIKALVTVI